ncbi:MAG: hypothetical protein J4215_04955 [Candidatus Diapherotrites archaeon]|uniref:Transcription regulator TrmB N-terminal domain-containing protein n=1 Tax=Candidatus Iainarchaeum sp. TaxID=3101447 RepID=A0A8T4L7M8_9ARCH|nr:hypothetical protein [Candidatus Diapherotrites archaeon]
MNASTLMQLGLSETEARIYLSLLRRGAMQAGAISKEAQVNRTTTYDCLERLIADGIVTYSIEANRKVFHPAPPNRFLDLIKEQEKTAVELLPELERQYKARKETEETNIYKGKKGIRSILQEILKYPNYEAFGSGGRFLEIMEHDFLAFQKRKEAKKIKSRIVVNQSARKTQGIREAFGSFRFVSDEFTGGPVTTFIFGNNVAIVVWAETPFATVISSPEAAKSFKNHFELLWKTARP